MKKRVKRAHSAPFARISDSNNEIFVAKQILRTGHTLTAIVGECIRAARTNTKFSLEPKVHAGVKKAEAAKQKRLERYGSLIESNQAHAG